MTQGGFSLKGLKMVVRAIAVVTSSIAAIISTALPLLLGYDITVPALFGLSLLLATGALLVHGVLTHVLNDLMDFESGTDQASPALLSGGSRVIQEGVMSLGTLRRMAVSAIIILLSAGLLFMVLGQFKLVTLTLIGIWGAVTYSTRPFIFAYRPFLGEWVSLFPSMLLLGLAAPWIMLDSVPLWAWQNAMINALWCMAWVMVHHIPDLNTDRNAVPKKRTSVVWSIERYGLYRAGLPALIYLVLVFIIVMTMISARPIGAVGALLMLGYAIYLILSMDVKDIEQVTQREKVLLLLAMSTAVWLGIFY